MDWVENLELSTIGLISLLVIFTFSLVIQWFIKRSSRNEGEANSLDQQFTTIGYAVDGQPSHDLNQGYLRSISEQRLTLVVRGQHHKGTLLSIDLEPVLGFDRRQVRGKVIKSTKFHRGQGSWLLTVALDPKAVSGEA
ncbi:hypothetical protein [Pseudobacteriovorax antillogorgiicola]|uniref:Uncharacterized protein n=1 Tax=Pseudobacteriovorax antillogorgiicola TaxID=1513793 RepID=A0A1Y6B3C2_9BACT|nr:hypothetical protein [Pseudobacteriovorax antillogorgiicola]TCS59331.1 hypothetical protein EDD56_101238 [Pseudobacteriovorax antillogorgiicola]SME89279.1 hypothetical protein SAMN06296036_101248 [Pseudobacteriovorax antillogorgiicola]